MAVLGFPDKHFDPEDKPRLADWAELCCLVMDRELSAVEIADVLHNSLLFIADEESDQQEEAAYVAEEIFRQLRIRAVHTPSYPFRISEGFIERRLPWADCLCFTSLLLADLSRDYRDAADGLMRSGFTRLFENIVRACLASVLGGASARFGWPVESGWPKPIADRVRHLAEIFALEATGADCGTDPVDKDLGLDIITRVKFGDEGPGTLYAVVQCATGQNWEGKTGTPSFGTWGPLLMWNAPLHRMIAFPWRWDNGPRQLARKSRRFEASILDRFRLLSGSSNPDAFLTKAERAAALRWCRKMIRRLPVEFA